MPRVISASYISLFCRAILSSIGCTCIDNVIIGPRRVTFHLLISVMIYLPLFMSKKLENRLAVITGATSGMALATAKLFVEEGAFVFITGRSQERLDKAIKEIGKNVTGVQGDACNLSDLDRLFEIVKKEKGRIDVLFASADIGELSRPLGSITEKGFDDTFSVNVRGTLFTVQKALPLMKDGGSIILNSSIAGVK